MAYESVHTGPEIDAAATLLDEIQEIRDESNSNTSTVVTLAARVAIDADRSEAAAGQMDGVVSAAQAARDAAQGSATTAGKHAATADSARALAVVARNGAQAAEAAIAQHATNAEVAAGGAARSETNAANSAAAAGQSATGANTSRQAAQSAEEIATSSAASAFADAGRAEAAAATVDGVVLAAESARDLAAESASTAASKAGEASTSALGAAGSASTATARASEAADSASTALSSRNAAETSANDASNSASIATTKASEASADASAAATARTGAESARDDAVGARDAAKIYRDESEGYRNQAAQSAAEAAGALFDDASIRTDRGWSSQKIAGLIDSIHSLLASDDVNLDELQEIVNYIKLNRAALDALGIDSIAGLHSALESRQPLSSVLTDTTASFTTALLTKLNGVAEWATANASDAALRDRSTHTGQQAISTVAGLQFALDAKLGSTANAASATRLATARNIAGKPFDGTADITITAPDVGAAPTNHTHTAAQITGLATVATSGDYNHLGNKPSIPTIPGVATGGSNGLMAAGDKSKLDGIASGATANETDAALRSRSTHTGTQHVNTITGLGNLATRNATTSTASPSGGVDGDIWFQV